MKTLTFFIFVLFFEITVSAQTPHSFRYQAVARDNSGKILTSQSISFRIGILSGSVSGTAVYIETHSGLTTNTFGLVELEIGKGIPVVGTFSSIDWGSNSYFVKIEMDPAGGSTYQVLSISQLLSVPYALYSQKAGNGFSGDYNDLINKPLLFDGTWFNITGKPTTLSGYGITDFDFTGAVTDDLLKYNGNKWVKFTSNFASVDHIHSNVTFTTSGFMSSDDKFKLDNLQNADGSETKISAGTNIVLTGTGTTTNPYLINAGGGSNSHKIGESYCGGIIFYVYDGGQHGLIAATIDQSSGVQWYNGTYRYTGTMSDGLKTGAMNTTLIVATQISDNQTGNFAAKICADYSVTIDGITYGDWYLPSKYELNLLYQQKSTVGGFNGTYYWSSSEINNYNAYGMNFTTGATLLAGKTSTNYVRAIRAF